MTAKCAWAEMSIIVKKFLTLYSLLEWITINYQLSYEHAITIQEQKD